MAGAGDRLGRDDRATGTTSGTSGSGSPRRWTPRSAAWGSAGRRRKELIGRALAAAKARPGRADRVRRGDGPPGAGAGGRRVDEVIRGLRGAGRGGRGARRADHPDGEPGAGRGGARGRTTTCGSTTASSAQVREPVIIHWLGRDVRSGARGLLGPGDHWEAMETCLDVIAAHADKVDGIKISLLSKEKEIDMRRRLPAGVRMYTGDDFNYAELIEGDAEGHRTRCSASSTRSRRRRRRRWRRWRGRGQRVLRHPRADGAAVAAHLQGADAVLQDGVVFLA